MNHYDLPLEVIERHATPRGEIQLQRRGDFFEIISNGTFLMATYNGESEKLLLREPLKRTSHPASVLIGGLGVGYSLQEALSDPRVEKVTVIEIEDKIIEWNRSVLSPVTDGAVNHPKSHIVHADCLQWLAEHDEQFDLICLDIDNGPDWNVYEQNETLYSDYGLALLARHLRPDGCLSFWSATSSPEFVTTLKRHFNIVDVLYVPQERGEPDAIFLTQQPILQVN